MTERRHPNVVNLSEIEPRVTTEGTRFGSSTRRLGAAAGGVGLGASYFEVEPGRTAFPAHWHCANEEAIYVLEGEGTARIGDARVPVRAGDWIAMPPGPEHAHQLVNTGTVPLRYLAISTMQKVEIVGYPDSKKFGAAAIGPSGPWVRHLFLEGTSASYYDGEDTGA